MGRIIYGCEVEETELDGYRGRSVDGVRVECSHCGHRESCYGTSERSVKRCLVMLFEKCPEQGQNFYTERPPPTPRDPRPMNARILIALDEIFGPLQGARARASPVGVPGAKERAELEAATSDSTQVPFQRAATLESGGTAENKGTNR